MDKEEIIEKMVEKLNDALETWDLSDTGFPKSMRFRCIVELITTEKGLVAEVKNPKLVKLVMRNAVVKLITAEEWKSIEELPWREKQRQIIAAIKNSGNCLSMQRLFEIVGVFGFNTFVQMNSLFVGANIAHRIESKGNYWNDGNAQILTLD